MYNRSKLIESVDGRKSLFRAVKSLAKHSKYRYLSHIEADLGKTSRSFIRTTIYSCQPGRIRTLLRELSPYISLDQKEIDRLAKPIKPITYHRVKGHYVTGGALHHFTSKRRAEYYRLVDMADRDDKRDINREIAKLAEKVSDRKGFWFYLRAIIIAHHMKVSQVSRKIFGNQSYLYSVIMFDYRQNVSKCCKQMAKIFGIQPDSILNVMKKAEFPIRKRNYVQARKSGNSVRVTIPTDLHVKPGLQYHVTKNANGDLMFKLIK